MKNDNKAKFHLLLLIFKGVIKNEIIRDKRKNIPDTNNVVDKNNEPI